MTNRRVLFFSLSVILFCFGCIQNPNRDERLAKTYCGSCHLYVSPELLDRTTWKEHVLPQMRFRMGLDLKPLWELPPDEVDIITRTIPRPMLEEAEWKKIEDFYLNNAPAKLPTAQRPPDDSLSLFKIESREPGFPPLVTLLKYDTNTRRTLAGSRTSLMYILDENFSQEIQLPLSSPPSDGHYINADSLHVLEMGKMDPNDLSLGRVVAVNLLSKRTTTLIDSLNRPVHFDHYDFDNDGDGDILISCFGNFTGALLLYERTNMGFSPHTLHNLPGNRKTTLRDVNKDGLMDIITLTTQGDEQLILYVNQNNLRFSNRQLFRFPAVFGSSHFELADIDGDGDEDIIYANGDNSDYSTILKPYHGIRILSNDGNYNFTETIFLPLNGAYQTVARDFDKDGDIDISAISFFNDYKGTPQRSFVYYENIGTEFKSAASPLTNVGRWIVMEALDVDLDGYSDLMLGALNFNLGVDTETIERWKANNAPILLLKNIGNAETPASKYPEQ